MHIYLESHIDLGMTSFVFTLGFHEDFIIRRLHASRAEAGDKIIVFTVKPASGAPLKAFSNLETYCLRIGLQRPVLIEIDVRERDFTEILGDVLEVVLGLEEPVVADLSGGMRILVIAIYTAIMISRKKAVVMVSPEGEAIEHRIDIEDIRILDTELTEEKREILEIIEKNPGTTIPEIARTLEKSEKTITNHVNTLKKQRLVAAKGKRNNLYLTKLGQIKLRIEKHSTIEKEIETKTQTQDQK